MPEQSPARYRKVLQSLTVHRAIPALQAVPTDVLIIWNDGWTDVMHRRRSDAAAVARALDMGAASLLKGAPATSEPRPPHHLHLVEG